jgi:hypothetical protein
MADEYWVDIIHNRPKGHHYVNDYDIVMPHAHVGDRQFAAIGKKYRLAAEVETVGGHHHHHRSRSSRYWGQPLFYVPDYGDVAINSTATDPDEIPDAVEGPLGSKKTDTLKPGEWFNLGQGIFSKNGRVIFVLQKDGNLVLYGDKQPLWDAGSGPGRGTTRAVMQTDGNFVIYVGNNPIWASDTAGHPGARLVAQDDGNVVVYQGAMPLWSTETSGFRRYTPHSFGGDLVHAFNTVASIAGAPVNAVTDVLEKIPIVGPVIHEGLALSPAKAIGGLTANVLQGERLDKAFLATAKDQLHHIREVAPYVQTVMSFVPGVGTGVAAAIAAGTALAEGRTISDAVIEGISKAVPGGTLGKSVLAGALAITHGDSVSKTVLDTVKANLPANLRTAVDTAVATAGGKNVRVAVLQALSQKLPPEAKKALDIGVALGAARNIQSSAVRAVAQPANIAKLASKPLPAPFQKKAPPGMKEAKGYKAAMGLLQHKGVTAHTIAALHSALPPAEKKGAEQAVKDYKNHFTQLSHTSLVRGGLVTRGNWKQVASNTKGAVPGRLVKGKSVTVGHFVRV